MSIHVPTTDCGGCCDGGGGGGGVVSAVSNYATVVYPLTTPVNVGTDGATAAGLAAPLSVAITNPSATQQMRIMASAMLPNLNLSARDAANTVIPGEFHYTRIGQIIHVETGNDATEAQAEIARNDGAPFGFGAGISPFIAVSLRFLLEATIAPGATATFELTDFGTTLNFDDVAIDHIRVGTQEQSNQARARIFAHGVLV